MQLVVLFIDIQILCRFACRVEYLNLLSVCITKKRKSSFSSKLCVAFSLHLLNAAAQSDEKKTLF